MNRNSLDHACGYTRIAYTMLPCATLAVLAFVLMPGIGCQVAGKGQSTAMTKVSPAHREIPALDDISIYSIDDLSPDKLLREQVVRDDLRFIGVMGYAKSFPGLPNDVQRLVGRDEQYYVIMQGTKDYAESPEEGAAITRGKVFAHQYNAALNDYLGPLPDSEGVDEPQE